MLTTENRVQLITSYEISKTYQLSQMNLQAALSQVHHAVHRWTLSVINWPMSQVNVDHCKYCQLKSANDCGEYITLSIQLLN